MEEKKSDNYLAHTANFMNKVDLLHTHLKNVANRASEYAEAFNASTEAKIAGLLHDLGKYGSLFQKRLEGKESGIDHWSAGAWAALTKYELKGIAAALAIQGHHIGLQQASRDSLLLLNPEKLKSHHPLGLRLSELEVNAIMKNLNNDGIEIPPPSSIDRSLYEHSEISKASGMLDIRMLFSALVDADFIETEAHFNPDINGDKCYREPGIPLEPEWALERLLGYLDELARNSGASDKINSMRADLLNTCREAAAAPPGLFTLTAPTGAGKTLSMLAFALRHAAKNHLRRIIVVIPYLSIIEQTVLEYRKVFSPYLNESDLEKYICEHHSLAGTHVEGEGNSQTDRDMEDEGRRMKRLLAENWDAPIIITTSVQLLESLFANRPSPCRKLHRLSKSVILFDEVQTLPVSLAVPTLATLSRLKERYGATVVFSTATQPAFTHLNESVRKYCASGWNPLEIVPKGLFLFERSKRIKVVWPDDLDHSVSWTDIADHIAVPACNQALCVVNLKRHALSLYEKLKDRQANGLFHLSTNMCPSHRYDVLKEVKRRLHEGLSCRLISTQCVEAGVDVDFPVVFRAWGPLDAMAQAAGRCNRNGVSEFGEVHIFFPEEESYPDGTYRQAAGISRVIFGKHGRDKMDIASPELFEKYYRELYDFAKTYNKDLVDAIDRRDFSDVAKIYRVIARDSINVLVPYDTSAFENLENEVRHAGLSTSWIRKARPYSVGLYRPNPDNLILAYLDPVPCGRNTTSDEWFIYLAEEHYSMETGLVPPQSMECLIA